MYVDRKTNLVLEFLFYPAKKPQLYLKHVKNRSLFLKSGTKQLFELKRMRIYKVLCINKYQQNFK